MTNLLIVESPGKIQKLHSFLGPNFVIKASMGHVRDLPEQGLGVAIANGKVQPSFAVPKRQFRTVSDLKQAAKNAQVIYLAMDPDREGEAIAWHVKQVIGVTSAVCQRITFNAITQSAVVAALKNPRSIDANLVSAQLARRVLDRLVGYKVSPLLWRVIGSGTSAGRVQSVALRLVVERERAIREFVPEDYWSLTAFLYREEAKIFPADLIELDGKPLEQRLSSKAEAERLQKVFEQGAWRIADVDNKPEEKRPFPPFITSTLQQAASVILGLQPTKTMSLAQILYEKGLITYMRTDSPAISDEAAQAVRAYIAATYPPEFLPSRQIVYRAKGLAQEAHECIRPADVERTPDNLQRELKADELKLYRLIWLRYVASQMTPARNQTIAVYVVNGNGLFKTRAVIQLFPGWKVLFPQTDKDDEPTDSALFTLLAELKPGDDLNLDHLELKAHQTKPPPRYTEASLIKVLEKEGIGRPSTYAPILTNIRSRGYVSLEKRLLYATQLGELIVDELMSLFSGFWMELPFTKDMESDLDTVAEGRQDWHKLIIEFDLKLSQILAAAPGKSRNSSQHSQRPAIATGPTAESQTSARSTSKKTAGRRGSAQQPAKATERGPGKFQRARRGKQKSQHSESPVDQSSTNAQAPDQGKSPVCPKCHSPLVERQSKFGRFLGCSRYPVCRFTQSLLSEEDQRLAQIHRNTQCPKCQGPMTLKRGKNGPFLSCQRYPDCSGILFLPKG